MQTTPDQLQIIPDNEIPPAFWGTDAEMHGGTVCELIMDDVSLVLARTQAKPYRLRVEAAVTNSHAIVGSNIYELQTFTSRNDANDFVGKATHEYRNATALQHAVAVYESLTIREAAYAKNPARGEYAGFAALHDLMDANMILPFADDPTAEGDDYVAFCNVVMELVSLLILNN